MIGSAQYVGLGENTHGSSEIFTMKFRLVKYLVTEMGLQISQWKKIGETA